MNIEIEKIRRPNRFGISFAGVALAAALQSAQADTYTAVDLSGGLPFGSANAVWFGAAAGYVADTVSFVATRATLWNGADPVDLHPAFLDSDTVKGRSTVQGSAQNLQVGWGAGPGTGGRPAPLMWRDSAESATPLSIPFANVGGQALGTDGYQIVGYGTPLIKDGTTVGPVHGLVWDAASGAAVDLGEGAQALGVGGGQQVGFIVKGAQNAALWSGSAKSLINLHPKDAVLSVAYGTDGLRHVGSASYDVRVRAEAAKGNKDKRFTYATVWTSNSAAGALNIHPYTLGMTHSYAMAANGQWIAGYAADETKLGTPAYFHAIVWDADYWPVDLNAYLPAGYVGARALAVDRDGNVAGVAVASGGQSAPMLWVRNPQ